MKKTIKIDWVRPSFEVYIDGEYNGGAYCNSWHLSGVWFLIKALFDKKMWRHYSKIK